VNADTAFRAAAVIVAMVLAAAPYWPQISAAAGRAMEAAKEKAGLIGRVAAIALLLAAAYGKVPLPAMPSMPAAGVNVETPAVEMQQLVQPVAEAIKSLPAGDRMLWAAVWSKAAVVVAGDAVTTEVAFTDTRSLRQFTVLAIDIAWRRIGQHVPGGNEPLRKAVEAAYGQAVGTDVVPVTADVRSRYAAFCKAVAWAGVNGG